MEIISKTRPWAHQEQAIRFALGMRGAMLALGMGCGKSLCTTAVTMTRGHKFVLIVAPKAVVPVWETEFKKHAAGRYSLQTLLLGTVAEKQKTCQEFWRKCWKEKVPGIAVVNYDSFWREPLGSYFLKVPIEFIVYDESHKLKGPDSRVSKFAARMAEHVPYRLALTGTPMPHSPVDIFAQFRAVCPEVFGKNFYAFRAKHCIMGGFEKRQVVGFQDRVALSQAYYSRAFRVDRNVLDLPDAVHVTRVVTLSASARRVYDELEEDLRSEIASQQITVANALVKMLRLQSIASGHVKTDDGMIRNLDSSKKDALVDVLDEIAIEEPVAVFCCFHRDLDLIKEAAQEAGRPFNELSGRENTLADWQARGKSIVPGSPGAVLATQMKAGSVGVDMTAARYCVFFNAGFSLGDYQQALCRVHRPGQKRSVVYVHLLTDETVDVSVMKQLSRKQVTVESILSRSDEEDLVRSIIDEIGAGHLSSKRKAV